MNSELRKRYPEAASLSEAKRWHAQGKPTSSSVMTPSVMTPEERRKLVEKPFGRIVVHGSSGGHGGCEMLPTVDGEGRYSGDNPWRGKRKPSIAQYENHE